MKRNEFVDRYTPFIVDARLDELLTFVKCTAVSEGHRHDQPGKPFYFSTVSVQEPELTPRGRVDERWPDHQPLAYIYVMPSNELDQIVAALNIYAVPDAGFKRNNPNDIYFEVYKRGDDLILGMKFQRILGSYALAKLDREELTQFVRAAEAACK